jgi:hypothetical protein
MPAAVKEYAARLDIKKRVTSQRGQYENYHVYENDNGTIMLEPRILVNPFEVSEKHSCHDGYCPLQPQERQSVNAGRPFFLFGFIGLFQDVCHTTRRTRDGNLASFPRMNRSILAFAAMKSRLPLSETYCFFGRSCNSTAGRM